MTNVSSNFRSTNYGKQTAGIPPVDVQDTRAIDFTDYVDKYNDGIWLNTHEYNNAVTDFINTAIDNGDGVIEYDELMKLGISRTAAEYLIEAKQCDKVGFSKHKWWSGDSGNGLAGVLIDLDNDDFDVNGKIHKDAIEKLELKAAKFYAKNPALKTWKDDGATATKYSAGKTHEQKVRLFVDKQSRLKEETDINMVKSGYHDDDTPITREDSIHIFAEMLADQSDGDVTHETLELLGLNGTGIKTLLNDRVVDDMDTLEAELSLLDKLDGKADGIIRKATVSALNRGEIIATNYIPSDINAGSEQPPGFMDKGPALTAAKAFINSKGCTPDDKEMGRQDIANILLPGLMLRAEALGNELDEEKVNKVVDAFIKKYGSDGKVTGAQAAEGLVDLDQQGNTSNCCNTYDGVIDAKHLEALVKATPDASKKPGDNSTGNTGNNGGNTTPPSSGDVSRVYSPTDKTTTNPDLKEETMTVEKEDKPTPKKSGPLGGLFGNLFGGGLFKSIGLAAMIAGVVALIGNKQPSNTYTAAPQVPYGGYNPYAQQGSPTMNGLGGMMNIFG